MQLIEEQFFDALLQAADKTQLDMINFKEQAEEAAHYHTGEITGSGTLYCCHCNKEINLHKTSHILPGVQSAIKLTFNVIQFGRSTTYAMQRSAGIGIAIG